MSRTLVLILPGKRFRTSALGRGSWDERVDFSRAPRRPTLKLRLPMNLIDVEKLLQPVSADAPCGENLEYDGDYAAMEIAATGKPEQQFGATVIPGEEPDWGEVRKKCLSLLERGKDLRMDETG